MIGRRHKLQRALIACGLAVALTSCSENLAERATCEAGDGQVSLAWQPLPGIDQYRVFRANDGMRAEPVGEVDGASFVDTGVQNGTRYGYIVRAVVPEGVEVPDVAACAVTPSPDDGGEGPDAVADLTCRAKSGRIDLDWTEIAGVSSYRVLRSGNGQTGSEVGDVVETAFADFGLVNGIAYLYEVVALDAQGNASENSNAIQCTPIARGEGEPPPVVAAPTCRGKNDKVDVSWTPVDGAAYYEIARTQSGQAPVVLGTVTGNVFADFGLPLDVAQQYTVTSVSATGAEAQPSAVCDVTPRGRADGNHPPVFTSEPLTTAIEQHYWWTQLVATDPDGDAISYSLVLGPNGMKSSDVGLLDWTPVTAQIGTAIVEVRATDARGAYTSQAFNVLVADFDEPPQITSIPQKTAEAGQLYQYDLDAFDPEGGALRFAFADTAPPGMSIDAASGLLSWTPSVSQAGNRTIRVRASDPAGGFDEQAYALDVFTGTLELLAPKGEFVIPVGETLDLEIRSNQPAATLYAYPLPRGATSTNGHFLFTPTADQVGTHSLGVKAKLGGRYALERITVRVVRDNQPPTIADPGPQTVAEGGELVVQLVTSDPDGDAVTVSPGNALPTNALLDDVAKRFVFRPSYEQAGSVSVTIAASDGDASSQVVVPIEVTDREPPVGFSELVIDRVQSPTLQPRVRISGNVVGDAAQDPQPEAFVAVNGLSPSAGRQGRTLDVAIVGLNTEFAQGQTAASFGDGITVESLTVTSPTTATARIAIAPAAALGTRVVTVSGNGPAASSIVAFVVEKGAIVFSGQLIDSFTQQPLANARVNIDGTVFEATTDAQGRFSIEGVPPGAQRIVIIRNDYDVRRLDLAFDPSVDVAMDDAIPLDALARPFQAGGSLPRAATVASVLDRGVSGGGSPQNLEQAMAVVQDTLLAVGGDQVGVLDESGAQLNPQVEASGVFSLTAVGVQAQAQAFLSGDRVTLGEIARNLTNAFDWGSYPPDEAALTNTLQRFANAAWEDPTDPLNAMALILLNDGTTLSSRPPQVSPSTSFNRFQTFLLVTSILLPSSGRLEASVEPFLIEKGVDVDAIDNRYIGVDDSDDVGALRDRAAQTLAWFGGWLKTPTAHAQEGGITLPPPNGYYNRDPFHSRAFTRLGIHSMKGFIADATIGNAMSALLAASIQATIAYTAGASGGAVGIAAATGFVSAMVAGVWGAALDKLVLGFALAAIADQAEPTPPIPERSFIDRKAKKLVIEFDPSSVDTSEGDNDQRRAIPQYSYELFDFNNPLSTDVKDGFVVSVASLSKSEERPNKLQFTIPLRAVQPGVHYFRIATIQYLSRYSYSLNESRIQFPYEIQPGANPPASILAVIGDRNESDFFKATYTTEVTEKVQFHAQVAAGRQAKFGGIFATFDSFAGRLDAEAAAISTQIDETKLAIDAEKVQFDASNQQAKVKSEALVQAATDHGKAKLPSADFENPTSAISQQTTQLVTDTTPTAPLTPEARGQLQNISTASRDAEIAQQRANSYQNAANGMQTRAQVQASGVPDPRGTAFTYEVINEAGEVETVRRTLPQGRRQANEFLQNERALLEQQANAANTQRSAALDRHQAAADQFFTEQAPSRPAHEARLKNLTGTQDALATDLGDNNVRKLDAEVHAKTELTTARSNSSAIIAKPKVKAAVKIFGGVSTVLQAKERLTDIVTSLQVLYSQLSAAHRFVQVLRDVPPYSIEPHPNLLVRGGVVSSEKGIEENGVVNEMGGTLGVTYVKSGEQEESKSTGFPPEFLAVDEAGNIYAHNGNSPQRFGGRIFRFLPNTEQAESIAREYVGSVNYYSTILGYANPANPVAMTVGEVAHGSGRMETLFIADVEYTDSRGTSISPPRAVLKELRIGLMAPGEQFADPSSRSRFVAQYHALDSRWRFDGPTDLASTSDATHSRVYVSDGQSIYVVKQDLGSSATEVIEILNQPGRRWSGLAFDLNEFPNFYFSDFQTGEVFYATYPDLIAAETSGSLNGRPLTVFGPQQVYDIEIGQDQKAIVAATREGFDWLPMPIVLRYDGNQLHSAVTRLGRMVDGVLAQGFDGSLFQILPLSQFEHDRHRARVVLNQQTTPGGPSSTQEADVRLAPAGPTEVDLR